MGAGESKVREGAISVKCDPYISASDIEDVMKKYDGSLTDDDCKCLNSTKKELMNHGNYVWKDAEFFVDGTQHQFLFRSGDGANQFICFHAGDKKYEAYCERKGWKMHFRDAVAEIWSLVKKIAEGAAREGARALVNPVAKAIEGAKKNKP